MTPGKNLGVCASFPDVALLELYIQFISKFSNDFVEQSDICLIRSSGEKCSGHGLDTAGAVFFQGGTNKTHIFNQENITSKTSIIT